MYHSYDIKICFCFSVLKTLIKLKKESPDYISIKALSKIKETIIRLGKIGCSFLFSLFIIFYSNPMLYPILNVTIYFTCITIFLYILLRLKTYPLLHYCYYTHFSITSLDSLKWSIFQKAHEKHLPVIYILHDGPLFIELYWVIFVFRHFHLAGFPVCCDYICCTCVYLCQWTKLVR